MLKLDDFFHLPQLDTCVTQMIDDEPGVIVVAGLDPRLTAAAGATGVRPSGRATIFRVLISAIMAGAAQALVVAEDSQAVRITRPQHRRMQLLRVSPPLSYADRVAEALGRRPDLLVIDRLCAASVPAAFAAAEQGLRVVSQLDTVFLGADIIQQLRDLGAGEAQLGRLAWVVAVQRLPTLCPHCRRPAPYDVALLKRLQRSLPAHSRPPPDDERDRQPALFLEAPGCAACGFSGRLGDVAVFDLFRAARETHNPTAGERVLPIVGYMLDLARLGYLSLADVLEWDAEQHRRTYRLLTASEQALAESNATLQRKLAELKSANQVLQQRTAALISLQDIGRALASSTNLDDLVRRVCRHARDLCGADRAILYMQRGDDTAEVLAVSGWEAGLVHRRLDAELVFGADDDIKPASFKHWPPGIPAQHADTAGFELRAGLRVPLLAEERRVGLMIVHTTQKARFSPGEAALLRTFADQAALSIQRAALIDRLRANIAQLEAAQAALVQQERLERELELARQVQQSVLPKVFPSVPGYTFAACNEPARQVGGDLYDLFTLDADRFGVVIADVSGKGMPAALYMTLTRSLLLAEARREPSPQAVLLNVHRLLRELGDPHLFVTVFYGVVEQAARRLTYARAGHDYPLLFRDGAIMPLGGVGVVLGFLDINELRLSEEQVALASGDRLVFYTDGLTDVLAPNGRRFDLEQLKAVLQSHIALSPEQLCAATFADLAAYQGSADQYDDMTMLVVAVD